MGPIEKLLKSGWLGEVTEANASMMEGRRESFDQNDGIPLPDFSGHMMGEYLQGLGNGDVEELVIELGQAKEIMERMKRNHDKLWGTSP